MRTGPPFVFPEAVVHPSLSAGVCALLNAGPNTWVVVGRTDGKSIYQRGCSGGSEQSKTNQLHAGAQEALSVFAGRPEGRERDFSILPARNKADEYRRYVNDAFSHPLLVRGTLPEKLPPTEPRLTGPSIPAAALSGHVLNPGSVEAIGFFYDLDLYTWASNYIDVVESLKTAGFEFNAGSRGEKFYRELTYIWEDRTPIYPESPKNKLLPKDLRNKTQILGGLKSLMTLYGKVTTIDLTKPPK